MKNEVIYRHKLALTSATLTKIATVTMAVDAIILKTTSHPQGLQMFESHAEFDAELGETKERHFVMVKTGVPYPAGATYVDSIIFGGNGFHVLELHTPELREAYAALYPAINEADAETELEPHTAE